MQLQDMLQVLGSNIIIRQTPSDDACPLPFHAPATVMAAAEAMALPKIIVAIIEQTKYDEASLVACTQLNKAWAKKAISQLWHGCPPITALAALPGGHLQHYANVIVHLEFSSEECKYHHHFTYTSFPRLKSVVLHDSEYNQDLYLQQYVQPRLRCFKVYGGSVSDAFLAQMQAC